MDEFLLRENSLRKSPEEMEHERRRRESQNAWKIRLIRNTDDVLPPMSKEEYEKQTSKNQEEFYSLIKGAKKFLKKNSLKKEVEKGIIVAAHSSNDISKK